MNIALSDCFLARTLSDVDCTKLLTFDGYQTKSGPRTNGDDGIRFVVSMVNVIHYALACSVTRRFFFVQQVG